MSKKQKTFRQKHLGRSPKDIAIRVLVAFLGAYGLAALFAATFSLVLPGNQAIAVVTSTLISFVLLVSFSVWALTAHKVSSVIKAMSAMTALLLAIWGFADA